MFSAVFKLVSSFVTRKITFYITAAALVAALLYLVSCTHGLQQPRFTSPAQVLVIECDDKVLVA